MIQGIPEITPDVDMICPRAMAKVVSQEYVVQSYRQTRGTSTAITDAQGGTFTDALGSMCKNTQTHGSTIKDAIRSTFTEDCASVCANVSTDSTGVHGSTCSYISTKGVGVHIVTSTDESNVKLVVRGRTNAYEECRRYKPI